MSRESSSAGIAGVRYPLTSSGVAGDRVQLGESEQFEAAGEPELAVDRVQVVAQRVFTDVEAFRDQLAAGRGIPGDLGDRLPFAPGQAGNPVLIRRLVLDLPALGQMEKDPAGCGTVDLEFAFIDLFDGLEQ